MATRADVCAVAREWIGTPFQHQQRMKGVAADCAGLLIGVARELRLVPIDFDVRAYAAVPDGTSLMGWCEACMQPVERAALAPGDVVVVAFDMDPQHLGIVADYVHGGLSLIHTASRVPNSPRGKVIETRLMFGSSMRFVAGFALPKVV